MNITHVISSISKQSGGTSTYLVDLLNALPEKVNNTLVCYKSLDPLTFNKNTLVNCVPLDKNPSLYANKKDLKKVFTQIQTGVFHANGLWELPTHVMSKYAKAKNIPYIISPHGMLEPWALQQSKLKKQIALKLFQHKDLKYASCLHATAKSEAMQIRELGYKNPIAIIPNGINLEEFPEYQKQQSHIRKLLFLSRIHPKKGIEVLIEAWKSLDTSITKNWEVDIVGNGDTKYIESLKKLIITNQLGKQIHIKAPVFGQDKIKTYQNADLFVLSTYSENFGIVVAEALACKVPVITTKGTPWEDLLINKCGDWIDIGVEPLVKSLSKFLNKGPEDLQAMGANGRKLIEQKYSMEAVAQDMLALYQWILKKGEKPNFVKLD